MLSSPVALVLGAGSSRDFGPSKEAPFPLGDDLRLQIARCLDIVTDDWGREVTYGSPSIHASYRLVSKDTDDDAVKVGHLVGIGRDMARALPGCESIDDLLERHSSNSLYAAAGKLAIAECIGGAERNSPLRQNPNRIELPRIADYSQHWLARFLQVITKGCSRLQLAEVFAKLKVVNFNYDRCFEWFTHLWLRHVYNLKSDEAWEVVSPMQVVHPYGSLGPLPNGSNQAVPFGADLDAEDLYQVHSNILTYSESVEEDGRQEEITGMTCDCRKVVFLGFAFHSQNMKLLHFERCSEPRQVYATTVGMEPPRWEAAQRRIWASLNQSRATTTVYESPISCQRLVLDYADHWLE